MSGLRNAILAGAAGWVIHLAFPTFGWWPAAIIGLALLWAVLEHAGPWQALGLGIVGGLGLFLPLLHWSGVAVGPIPWIALSLLEALAVGLFASVWALVRRRKLLRGRVWAEPLVFAALWTSAEELRSIVPFGGFPWGRLAFSQVDGPAAGLAWLGGAPLVTFAVACVGGCAGLAFEAMRGRRLVVPVAAATAGAFIMLVGVLVPLDTTAQAGTLRVGVVQGNVPDLGLDAFAQARLVLENHVTASEDLAANTPWPLDLVVWPENSADYDPRRDSATRDAVTGVAALFDAPLLLGTQDYSPPEGRYNVALLWTRDGEAIDSYAKRRPAPFAEYIPMRSFARFFSSAVDRVTRDMLPGTEVGVLAVPVERLGRDVAVGDVICFEVAYDALVRDTVQAGAEVLIVQTNNANFGRSPESEQQLAMTRFRAIETGRVAIQSSTVGVSGIISPDGTVVHRTALFTADSMVAEVPLRTSITPAVRVGTALGWVFLLGPLATALLLGLAGLRGRWEWE